MKKYLALSFLVFLAACGCSGNGNDPDDNNTTPAEESSPILTGADISWLSEMESDGKTFRKLDGTPANDLFEVLLDCGLKAVRLRVWVDPYGGWSGKADVLSLAKRAASAGLDIMIDFHYSDFFADPSRQVTPSAWKGDTGDLDLMCSHVREHTTDVLSALKAAGVTPKWVQIGNETRNGMLHPTGQLWNASGDIAGGWAKFAALFNAGYDAAKAVFPQIVAMPHLNNAWEDNNWWFSSFKKAGGKLDAIALSHYPQAESGKKWSDINASALAQMESLKKEFQCDIYVSEIGVKTPELESTAVTAMSQFMAEVRKLDGVKGVFYWEPEVYGNWRPAMYKDADIIYQYTGKRETWGAYNQGAFLDDGRPSSVMKVFK